ncbi:CBS domain-containing protein [Comamonas granuli]|uniref:CBS domain-containing protein n=1 Tax=Comamonas granuli TaxID=290309 RepID=UPI0005AB475B|nr:CBS domain-containing protein [Comamonas granuli]
MTSVAEILKSKPDASVHSVAPGDTVFQALRTMADKDVGALLVLEAGAIVGIFTERDYARRLALQGRPSMSTPVRDVMTSTVLCVRSTQTSEQCMQIMTGKRLRHLPVVDDGRLLGMISIGDLVKDIISEQQFIIEQLEHYIAGRR